MRLLIAIVITLVVGCHQENAAESAMADDAQIERAAGQGCAIVDAIFQFRNEWGVWPASESELNCEQLGGDGLKRWRFQTSYDGNWTLGTHRFFPHGVLAYKHPDGKNGKWVFYNGLQDSDVACEYKPPCVLSQADPKKIKQILSRRIASSPKQIIHHKGLISLLYKMRSFDDASEACKSCLETWPRHWWATLMLALIEKERGNPRHMEQRLQDYAAESRNFHDSYFLAYFYFSCGRRKEALESLQCAVNNGIQYRTPWNKYDSNETGEMLGWSDESFLLDAAMLAYRMEDRKMCLAICHVWSDLIEKQKGYGDPGYRVIRAACFLNAKDLDKAQDEIEMSKRGPSYDSCRGLHVEQLEKAIRDGDTGFRYSPDVKVPLELCWGYK